MPDDIVIMFISSLLLGTAIGAVIEHFRTKSAYADVIKDYKEIAKDYKKQKREMWNKIREGA